MGVIGVLEALLTKNIAGKLINEKLKSIANDIRQQIVKPNERILFLNHSHAGQLCCIITQLLEDKEQAKELL